MGDVGSIPALGKSPGEGKGYLLWYSGLENSMDYIVGFMVLQRVRGLSDFHFHSYAYHKVGFNFYSQLPIFFTPIF